MTNMKDFVCPICGSSNNKIMRSNKDVRAEQYMKQHGIENVYQWHLCCHCGNGFQHPEVDSRVVQYIWNINRQSHNNESSIDQRAIQLIKEGESIFQYYAGAIKDNKSALDIGCGYGGLVKVLQDNGFDATGIDLDLTTKQMHDYLGIKTEIGFIEEIMPDSTFDVIFSNYALYFISDIKEFLANLKSHLNKGGLLCITLANFLSSFDLGLPGYIHSFFPNEYSMRYLLEECGYQVLSIEKKKTVLCIIAKPDDNLKHPVAIVNSRWIQYLLSTKSVRYYLFAKPILLLRKLIKR